MIDRERAGEDPAGTGLEMPLEPAPLQAPVVQAHAPPELASHHADVPHHATAPTQPHTGRTYWQAILHRFARPVTVRVATAYIFALALLAVFVPLIANSHPFTIVMLPPHGPPVRRFPLFRALTSTDLILFYITFCIAALIAYVRLALRKLESTERKRRRTIAILATALIALVGSVAIGVVHQNVLDARNYRRMVRQHVAKDAVFAPISWGYADMEPLEKNLVYKGPSARHLMGTDGNGRDVLSRLLWSARIVMAIGFISQVIAVVIGIAVGAVMGYFVGVVDLLGMRLVEIVEAIPTFFLILIFVAAYGRHIEDIMIILGITGWTGTARFVRAEFFRIRKMDYVTAAIAAGLPLRRVLFRHMLPNGITPVIVSMTFGIAGAVMTEASLSFLGVGVKPPTPSWGSMLNDAGNPASNFHWWLALAPGVLIFLTVFAYNVIGESLRDAIDPQAAR